MRRRFGLIAAASAVVVVVLVVAAGFRFLNWFSDPTFDPDGTPAVDAAVEEVATGLETPWGLAFRPNGTAIVSERDSGRILEIAADGRVSEMTRIAASVHRGEGGLLGVALSPDGWLYVYYTTAADNRIARLRPGSAEPLEVLVTGIPAARNHNGGRLAFGPDGYLYAGTGDAGEKPHAQDRGNLGGKILRMTPDGKPAPGNPFGTLVWSYGHRNVQGLAWAADGTMYASEFGQDRYDELNRIEPGKNYGWPEVEGDDGDDRYVRPIATWTTDDASPSGIAVVGDRVYIACLRGTRIWRVTRDGTAAARLLDGDYGRLRTVAPSPDGSIWALTSNTDNRGDRHPGDDRVLRFRPPPD